MSLSQSATVLVVVFAFCLVAVTAQLCYVLWWKRRFHRRSVTGPELGAFSTRGGDVTVTPPPSKELLYFFIFCLENKQYQIGSATAPPLPADVASKWSVGGENILCGPSETLFTIPEDITSDTDHKTDEIEPRGSISTEDHVKGDELEEGFSVRDRSDDELEEIFGVTDRSDDELEEVFVVKARSDDEVDSSDYNYDGTTPFSTPCSSPPFYTPSPSPIRDDHFKTLGEERLCAEIV